MKHLLTNEQALIKEFNEHKVTKRAQALNLWCLIEIGSEVDDDGEEFALTANHVFIKDNKAYLQDKDYSDTIWEFAKLSIPTQQEVLRTIRQTLSIF